MRSHFVLFILIALMTTFGCVFVSEPDIGASSDGPGFYQDDSEPDPLGGAVGGVTEMEAGEGGRSDNGSAPTVEISDAGLEDVRPPRDIEVPPADSEPAANDTDVQDADIIEADIGLEPEDLGVPDAQPEPSDCGTAGCSRTGYCDDDERPECWIGDAPQCYDFQGRDETNPKAYARCCGQLGTCGPSGQWCEPLSPDYCALEGNPTCATNGDDPISQYLCANGER